MAAVQMSELSREPQKGLCRTSGEHYLLLLGQGNLASGIVRESAGKKVLGHSEGVTRGGGGSTRRRVPGKSEGNTREGCRQTGRKVPWASEREIKGGGGQLRGECSGKVRERQGEEAGQQGG